MHYSRFSEIPTVPTPSLRKFLFQNRGDFGVTLPLERRPEAGKRDSRKRELGPERHESRRGVVADLECRYINPDRVFLVKGDVQHLIPVYINPDRSFLITFCGKLVAQIQQC